MVPRFSLPGDWCPIMLATERGDNQWVSAASVKGHIWVVFGPVKHFLQFYFRNPRKPRFWAAKALGTGRAGRVACPCATRLARQSAWERFFSSGSCGDSREGGAKAGDRDRLHPFRRLGARERTDRIRQTIRSRHHWRLAQQGRSSIRPPDHWPDMDRPVPVRRLTRSGCSCASPRLRLQCGPCAI